MHHFPRIFVLKKQHKSMDHLQSPNRKSTDQSPSPSPRKLVRRNAAKNFDYTPSASSSTSLSESGSSAPRTRSLDLPHYVGSTSFRIEGKDGEIDSVCESLGVSPEDLGISIAEYELMKSKSAPLLIKSSPDFCQQSQKDQSDLNQPEDQKSKSNKFVDSAPHRCGHGIHTNVVDEVETDSGGNDWGQNAVSPLHMNVLTTACRGGGVNGDRPPLLTAPSSMSPHFCAHSDGDFKGVDDKDVDREEPDSGSCSFSTINDDDSSSTTTEAVSIISPNSGCRINITQWDKGKLLGKGSFGTVYQGYSCEGNFFAVKEVSLLEQGSQGRQSIDQLQREIELLSQLDHENIVRYLGTDQADSNLYIFLEFMTQGSLAMHYQNYHLRDSHVSNYTRQILLGLKYLHDRKVVHRDIKCANILLASDGTVKLADFGLAKAARFNDLKSCKGTVFWMAPEVMDRKNQGYGLAADIWSLGCTVLEMLMRHVPYYPLEFQQAVLKIGRGEPPPIPDELSSDARDFIQQCLRVNPYDRPTAGELLAHQFLQ